MKPLTLLTTLLIMAVPSFAQTPELRGEIGADAPAGKPYIYKHSAGKPRQMEIFFPPGHDPAKSLGTQTTDLQIAPGQSHSFFNKDPWRTVTLIAADRFLVKQGLLTGETTLQAPATGETLIPQHKKL
jgi:hypothetical protein